VLAEACPFPVTLSSLPGERLPPSVESAAYYLIAQALKRCRCGGARIRAVPAQGRLLIDIETDGGPPDEVIDLEDRIGALDGRLAIERLEPVGTRIHAELPCGS
jgi:hypothetical protein